MAINLETAKPREIEAYLREVVRTSFGDKVENKSTVIASSGYYSVSFEINGSSVDFINFRKSEAKKIARAIRALK